MLTQLNLKNDTLRRRYDSLKYDIKKIEEGEHSQVIYMLQSLTEVWLQSRLRRIPQKTSRSPD